jgi:hypothetical protein
MATIELGVPYLPKEQQSLKNSQAVIQAVRQRFPEWADQAVPYVNVLTFRQWVQRGYGVKKGEKSIRITVMKDIPDEDNPKQTRRVRRTACLFALPQVEKK